MDALIFISSLFAALLLGIFVGVHMANSTAAMRWFKSMKAAEDARLKFYESPQNELARREDELKTLAELEEAESMRRSGQSDGEWRDFSEEIKKL